MAHLKDRAEALGVSDRVRFLGARPREWLLEHGPRYFGLRRAVQVRRPTARATPGPWSSRRRWPWSCRSSATRYMGIKDIVVPETGFLAEPGDPVLARRGHRSADAAVLPGAGGDGPSRESADDRAILPRRLVAGALARLRGGVMLRLLTAMRSFWLFGASILLTKGMALVTIPLVTGRLAPSDYGRLELVMSVVEAFAIVMTLGLADSLFRFAAPEAGEQAPRDRGRPDRNGDLARGRRGRASPGRRVGARSRASGSASSRRRSRSAWPRPRSPA